MHHQTSNPHLFAGIYNDQVVLQFLPHEWREGDLVIVDDEWEGGLRPPHLHPSNQTTNLHNEDVVECVVAP